MRRKHGAYRGRPVPLRREDNLYSVRGVAELLQIRAARVYAWVAQAHLAPVEGGPGRAVWFRLDDSDFERLRSLRAWQGHTD